jgi:hypothetical protein
MAYCSVNVWKKPCRGLELLAQEVYNVALSYEWYVIDYSIKSLRGVPNPIIENRGEYLRLAAG